MILKEILERTTKFFKEKNFESARLESELLISNALGLRRIDLYLKFEQPLKDEELEKCRTVVRRRIQGEPVAYILGNKDFYNLNFNVDSRVLIPRPETELLVEICLRWLKKQSSDSLQVLDLGSGSGCIGLTIAKNESRAEVSLVEASADACEVILANRQKLGLEQNTTLINSRVQDAAVFGKKWDLIVANPPYIAVGDDQVEPSVKQFEPNSALFAGDDGLAEIIDWAKVAAPALSRPGLLIFEIGMTQGSRVAKTFESLKIFDQISIKQDLAGLDRFVAGENFTAMNQETI